MNFLNNNTEISNTSIAKIKGFEKLGHKICLITGRPVRAAIKYYNQLGLDTLMGNFNGAIICNPSSKKFGQIEFCFSIEIAKQILTNELIDSLSLTTLIETRDGPFWWKRVNNKSEALFEVVHASNQTRNLNSNPDDIKDDLFSIVIEVKDYEHFLKIREVVLAIAPTFVVRTWSITGGETLCVEINSQFANKGTALKYLSAYYGIPLARTIAIGDGSNDLGMLKEAGIGVAMKQGHAEAIGIANFVTDFHNNDDGVVKILDKIIKIL